MGIVGIYPSCFRKSGKYRTYGIRNLEECTEDGRLRKGIGIGRGPLPWFCVSVASKGFSKSVSLLFATLAGRCISVAAKGFRKMVRQRNFKTEGAHSTEMGRSGS